MPCSHTSPGPCNPGLLGPSLAEICQASEFLVFMTYVEDMIRSNEKISGTCERIKPIKTPDEEYDFVVIGGGAGGSVVAARLSEIPEWKVLLLEAGPDEPAGAGIPSFTAQFLQTRGTWNYTTVNETHGCLATNGSCHWSSGKNLGGNTVHNSMIYMRGNPTDYDNWAALGNEGWTSQEVEKYFLKSEDNGEIERVGRVHHATGGLVSVERFRYFPDVGHRFLAAAEELGYGITEDLNGDRLTGFAVVQAMNKNGVRCSSASAYLRPIRHRKNLHISLNSYATKVIIENKKAVGVEYYKDGERRRVNVTREVIVCGGAIESPHLLLLSGIGPKEHLKSIGIEVIKDLPGVGENFHDHICAAIEYTLDDIDKYDNDYQVAHQYDADQTGPMSAIGLTQVVGILASNATTFDYPDVQVFMLGYRASCAPGEVNATRSTGPRSLLVGPTYLHPKSRGRISLASKNPFEYPLIWVNYMGDPSDVDNLLMSMKMTLALADTKALRDINYTMTVSSVGTCSNYTFLTDEYLVCLAKYNTWPLSHLAGSCKMGPASDPMAVVDPRLRVYGIKGLRVADASIMPQVTSGNTGAPSMMIGERAADFVKKDWGRSSETS